MSPFDRWRLVLAVSVLVLVVSSARAEAQWYLGGGFGANHTESATVSINQPSLGTSVDFQKVDFQARPFKSPQYYSWEVGRLFGKTRRYGLEFEFTHLKVIADTDRTYAETGQIDSEPVETPQPMNSLVQRYAMTHGLNFLVVNLVRRMPLGSGRATLITRIGGGSTLPHAETTINDESREQYQYGGPGGDAAAGLTFRLKGQLSAVVEYRVTVARPKISVPDGTGQMWAVTHQIAFGLAFGL